LQRSRAFKVGIPFFRWLIDSHSRHVSGMIHGTMSSDPFLS
jgi:hypothetical protein